MDMLGFVLQTIARAIENALTNFISSRKKPNASVALECIVWDSCSNFIVCTSVFHDVNIFWHVENSEKYLC